LSKDVAELTDDELKLALKKVESSIKRLTLKKKAVLEEISRRRFLHPPRKSVIILSVSLIIAYALFLRFLHLLNPDHYYMISSDSYIFHHAAERIMAGQQFSPDPLSRVTFSTINSGLAYPLAYIASIISLISQMPPSDALTLTCKILPPTLSILTVPLIFFTAAKTHNWAVGLFSALTWAILPVALFIQGAGYVDRDGLSMLLIMIGAFTFYLSKDWHFKLANRDLGWMLAALSILGVEAILFLEWNFGPLLLLIILASCFTAIFLGKLLQGISFRVLVYCLMDVTYLTGMLKELPKRFATAVKESNWRPFAIIILLNLLALCMIPELAAKTQKALNVIFAVGEAYVAEAVGLTQSPIAPLEVYGILVFPLLYGLYRTLREHRQGDLFWLAWFLSMAFLSFFAVRSLIYTAPAACAICGLALAPIINFRNFRRLKKIGVVLFLIMLASLTLGTAYLIGSGGRTAPNNYWHDTLIWLRDNTPSNAVIMTWWDYGYWIVDTANRKPVWDNSYQTLEENRDIATVYCTNDTSIAVQIMEKYNASYLIFSKLEVAILPTISNFALGQAFGDGLSVPEELKNSLYYKVVFGNFTSESGLKVVHRIPDVDPYVVILKHAYEKAAYKVYHPYP
jgi:asparagine N-glycosylation enzyme membrane subunit Stt3